MAKLWEINNNSVHPLTPFMHVQQAQSRVACLLCHSSLRYLMFQPHGLHCANHPNVHAHSLAS